jgi:hypothetical protein
MSYDNLFGVSFFSMHKVSKSLGDLADIFFNKVVSDYGSPATCSEFDHINTSRFLCRPGGALAKSFCLSYTTNTLFCQGAYGIFLL